MSTARVYPIESRRYWLAAAACAIVLVAAMLWVEAVHDRPPGRLLARTFSISPAVVIAYLVATATEWLARAEKEQRLDQGLPRWIAMANGIVTFLFLASAGAHIVLLAMVLTAWQAAPHALRLIMPTLVLAVMVSVILVMALRTPLLFAEAVANLKDRRARR